MDIVDINTTIASFKRDMRAKKAINLDKDIFHIRKMGAATQLVEKKSVRKLSQDLGN